MNAEQHVPQFRFKDFSDSWVQRNLGDLAEIVRGASPRPIQDPKWFDDSSEIGWLRISDVTEQNGRIHHLDQHISEAGQAKTRVLTEPHLLLSIAATVGKPLVNYVKTGVHDGFLIFMNPKFDLEFMFQWLESYRDKWSRYGQPGSQVNLNSDLVKNQSISIPSMDEQQKLGEFFTSIDNLIAANQRKLDLLKEQKKGYLQKMFPKNGAKVPELRFAGFADAWEQRKLSDAVDNIGTGKSKYMLQEKSDLAKYEVLGSTSVIGYDEDYDHEGDFILTARVGANAGNLYHHSGKVKITDNTVFIQGKNLAFIYNLLTQFDLKKLSFGTGQPLVKASELKNLILYFPNNDEQAKIGSYFKQLDHLITLHQRKLDLLKEQKKGYLQKMFPKNGAKVPELRFAGFTDAWEEHKLGELSNIVGGGTPSTSNSEYWDGDIDWYAPAEIGEQRYVSKSKKTITELGLKKSSARILPVGTVLFTSRAGIGNTAILGKEATTNQGFQSIVPNPNKLDSYFIYSRTNELKRYGEVTGAGSTFVEVSGKQMSKMSIMIPELSEQKKIGSFFKQLDNTIALHQRKLDLLKEQKKGFLQKMFI